MQKETKKTVQYGGYIFHLVDLFPMFKEQLMPALQSTGSRGELTRS